MSPETLALALVAAAYFIGAIPFGFLTAKIVRGIDIRQHGSGNIGATNVGRVLGGRWGILVLLLDLLKGLLPVLLVRWQLHDTTNVTHWEVAAAVAAIVGHMFPCWLGFRGGKGVATALGVVLCLAPVASLTAAAVFAVTFALFWIVSLASIVAALSFAVMELVLLSPAPFSAEHWSLGLFSVLIPALIVLRHRSNFVRLLRGEEPRFQRRAS
jgi:acyl phosphate:glycerol-3-phosphate acyltransferase